MFRIAVPEPLLHILAHEPNLSVGHRHRPNFSEPLMTENLNFVHIILYMISKKSWRRANRFRQPEHSWLGVRHQPNMLFVPHAGIEPAKRTIEGHHLNSIMSKTARNRFQVRYFRAHIKKTPKNVDFYRSISDAKVQRIIKLNC